MSCVLFEKNKNLRNLDIQSKLMQIVLHCWWDNALILIFIEAVKEQNREEIITERQLHAGIFDFFFKPQDFFQGLAD